MKCNVCGKEVKKPEEMFQGKIPWVVNGAVLGEYITVEGHKTCCENVNQLVVIPNRLRLMAVTKATN